MPELRIQTGRLFGGNALRPKRRLSIYISDGRIVRILAPGNANPDLDGKKVETIDASDLTVLPRLINAHFHPVSSTFDIGAIDRAHSLAARFGCASTPGGCAATWIYHRSRRGRSRYWACTCRGTGAHLRTAIANCRQGNLADRWTRRHAGDRLGARFQLRPQGCTWHSRRWTGSNARRDLAVSSPQRTRSARIKSRTQRYRFPLRRLHRGTLTSWRTLIPELLNKSGQIGTLSPGAYADLIAVEGDPVADLKIMADPERFLKLVIRDGKVIVNRIKRST